MEILGEKKKVLVTQSCPTVCDPVDCSPLGSSVHGILQARILGWVAIPFSRTSSRLEIEPKSPALQADSLLFEPPEKPSGNSCILLNPQSNITGRKKDILVFHLYNFSLTLFNRLKTVIIIL